MMWIALLCGVSIAAGVGLLAGSIRRPPPSLVLPVSSRGTGVSVATLRRMELDANRSASTTAGGSRYTAVGGIRVDSDGSPLGRRRSIGNALVGDGSGWSTYRDVAADLRVVDYTLDYVIYQQVLTAVAGFSLPLVLFLMVFPLGGLSAPVGFVVLLGVALGAGGFYLPLHNLRQEAAARRREFAAALSHYVSFVDVLVSGGNSIDSSFEFAADLGQGWVWDELRFAIASASSATLAPYRACLLYTSDAADD